MPRATDGTPACSCGRLASDAHRDTRTAQAAAAEDFDPVRIRPFVKVGEDTEDPESARQPSPSQAGEAEPYDSTPALLDVDEQPPADDPQDGRRRRRRALMAAGVGAAAVAVLVTGGIVGGLFSYEAPSRDGSGPDDIRAGLPEAASGNDASSAAAPSRTAASASPSETPSTSPAATPTESRATPTGSRTPTKSPANTGATATAAPGPTGSAGQDPVLGLGDKGAEVTELQLRLGQIGLYNADADGDYDREVESAVRSYQLTRVVLDDESGVYGKETRASLESETSQP